MKSTTNDKQTLNKKTPFQFSWKTPKRTSGSMTLPLIPNEIYLAIFDYLEPSESPEDVDIDQLTEYRANMSNLALVCRFFCAESIPRIFRAMTYSGHGHGKSTPSYAKFCRELVAGEDRACYLAQYVHECSITHWMQAVEPGAWVFANFLKLYVKSIPRLASLETLRLHDTPIDLKFLTSLEALERLKSLTISACDFGASTKETQLPFTTLKLTHFELSAHRNNALLVPLSQIVASSSLRMLHTDNWEFLKAVMSLKVDFGIETLVIPVSVPEISHLQKFLRETNSILGISIISIQSFGQYRELSCPLLDLPASSLPHLRSLECPSCLIDDFVHGRPLISIKITLRVLDPPHALQDAQRDERKTLSALRRSTAVVKLLQVPADVYAFSSFHEIFPRLEALILETPIHYEAVHDSEYIKNLCTKWPQAPPISSLHFIGGKTTWDLDLPLQHLIISDIALALPNLTRARITTELEWRRTHAQDDHWEPTVIKGRKAALKLMLADNLSGHSNHGVQDYGGIFSDLFDSFSSIDKVTLHNLGVISEAGSRSEFQSN